MQGFRFSIGVVIELLVRAQRGLGWVSSNMALKDGSCHWWENIRCKQKQELMYQCFHFIEIVFIELKQALNLQ